MMSTRTKLIHKHHMWACGTALLVDTQTNYPSPPACDKPFNSTFISTHKYWMLVKVSRTQTRWSACYRVSDRECPLVGGLTGYNVECFSVDNSG